MPSQNLAHDPLNIVICGVGGQGNVLAARLLGRALTELGYQVTIGETYGVSQRGGPVMSHLRVSRSRGHSPLIPLGKAHVVLALEPMEALRILADYGNPEVATIVNTRPVLPVTMDIGATEYPEDAELREAIRELSARVWFLDATDIALKLGTPLVTNMIMIGALAGLELLPLGEAAFGQTLREHFSVQRLDLNLEAFQAGVNALRRGVPVRRR